MEIAKVTSKGQITVPKEIRDKLNLETGSKIVFLQVGDEIVIRNPESVLNTGEEGSAKTSVGFYKITPDSLPAFRRLQEAFDGFAEAEGLDTEEDIVEWIDKLHQETR